MHAVLRQIKGGKIVVRFAKLCKTMKKDGTA